MKKFVCIIAISIVISLFVPSFATTTSLANTESTYVYINDVNDASIDWLRVLGALAIINFNNFVDKVVEEAPEEPITEINEEMNHEMFLLTRAEETSSVS